MKSEFEAIYRDNVWGGSGSGSKLRHNRKYMKVLQDLLRKEKVRTVLDLGCGDWQFSRRVDWSGVKYVGFDLVKSVVAKNQQEFASDNISFESYDGNLSELPPADLLIVKDVLQHWSNKAILKFLDFWKRYPLVLVTNCTNRFGREVENVDDVDGGSRPLDLRKAPFFVDGELLLNYTNLRLPWQAPAFRKHVLLVQHDIAPA